MTDRRLLNAVAVLEQARAQLEIALQPDAHWRALAQASLPAHRAALERALADNPVFHAWRLLDQALEELRVERATDQAAATYAAEPQAPLRSSRIELRQVLERLRSETPFDAAEPTSNAATAAQHGPAPPQAAPAIAPADIEIEEATVHFIVREPAAAPPPVEPPVPPRAAASAGPDAPSDAPPCEDDDDSEAEVTIVPRRG